MKENLKDLYDNRFSDDEKRRKNGTWVEICRYIERTFGVSKGTVVDIAAGYCDFINNYMAEGEIKRFAIDANPDVKKFAAENVTAICDGIEKI